MSIADAMAFTVTGGWDVFDKCLSVPEHIEHLLETDRSDNGDPIVEWQGDQYVDPDQKIRDDLARARELIDEARLLCQQCMSEF